jgi:addiction module HigA family antidote
MVTKVEEPIKFNIHPGELLQENIKEMGITQTELARRLHVTPGVINEICNQKRGISVEMALKLGRVFKVSAQFWINAQKNWEYSQLNEADYDYIKPFSDREIQA